MVKEKSIFRDRYKTIYAHLRGSGTCGQGFNSSVNTYRVRTQRTSSRPAVALQGMRVPFALPPKFSDNSH